jgi:hypothetical protein
MTAPWPPLVLGVVEEQGLRRGTGGFPSLVTLRDRTSLKFRELLLTNLGSCAGFAFYNAV